MCVEGVLLKLTRKWLPNPSVLLVTCLGVDWLRSHCLTAHIFAFSSSWCSSQLSPRRLGPAPWAGSGNAPVLRWSSGEPANGGPAWKTKSRPRRASASPRVLGKPRGVAGRAGALCPPGSGAHRRLSPRGQGQNYTPRAFPTGRWRRRPEQGRHGAFVRDEERSQPTVCASTGERVSVLSALRCASLSLFCFILPLRWTN